MARLEGVPNDVALLTGPLLLGNCFAYGLHGILFVQLYIYHINFTNDRTWIKSMVWIVFALECIATAWGTHAAWSGLASGWGDPVALGAPTWTFTSLSPLCGTVALIVHLFYCWRIWALSKSYILPTLIAAISIMQCVMAFYTGIKFAILGDFELFKGLAGYVVAWLGGGAVCDLLIATSMVVLLLRAGSRTTFKSTSSVVNKMITLTIETGAITAFASIVEMILLLSLKETNLHFTVCIMLTKIYAITLYSTLNARVLLRNPGRQSQAYMQGGHAAKAPLWDESAGTTSSDSAKTYVSNGSVGVHVSTTTEVHQGLPGLDKTFVIGNETDSLNLYDIKSPRTPEANV